MLAGGDDLISITVAGPAEAQALAEGLRQSGEWIDVVAGIDSVVVRYDISKIALETAKRQLTEATPLPVSQRAVVESIVEIPIHYGGEDGPDLAAVCAALELTKAEFIALHCGEYVVDMLGFVPGFAYVGGLSERLIVDRLSAPRQSVPAGSIGIAGGRTGLYSLPGPGGWPVIGRTSRSLFDASADNPFTLSAGAKVVFTAIN